MEEKKLDILYDHYKDTNEIQRGLIQKRDLYTLIVVAMIAILSFLVSSPEQARFVSSALIEANIGKVSIDFSHINTVILFSLMWIATMYFRVCLLIEQRYRYIKGIESKLSIILGPDMIERESKGYLDHYPWVLNVIHSIYTYGFPIILILAMVAKWVIEESETTMPFCNGHFILDSLFILSTCLISFLYFLHRLRNSFRRR